MSAPVMTTGSAGNVRSSATLAASGTANYDIDYSTVYEAQIQVGGTFGTVAGTSGIQIDIFRRIGTTPVTDTVAVFSTIISSTASTTKARSIALSTGKYNIKITNLDATNAVTSVYITGDTISSIA